MKGDDLKNMAICIMPSSLSLLYFENVKNYKNCSTRIKWDT